MGRDLYRAVWIDVEDIRVVSDLLKLASGPGDALHKSFPYMQATIDGRSVAPGTIRAFENLEKDVCMRSCTFLLPPRSPGPDAYIGIRLV